MFNHRERPVAWMAWLLRCTLAGLFSVIGAGAASAHVKWFCAYNVAGQPRGLEKVLCQDFELLVGVAVFWLVAVSLLERSPLGEAMARALNRATSLLRIHSELVVRAVCGFFFVSI